MDYSRDYDRARVRGARPKKEKKIWCTIEMNRRLEHVNKLKTARFTAAWKRSDRLFTVIAKEMKLEKSEYAIHKNGCEFQRDWDLKRAINWFKIESHWFRRFHSCLGLGQIYNTILFESVLGPHNPASSLNLSHLTCLAIVRSHTHTKTFY